MVQQVKDLDELKALFTSAGDKLVVIDFYATWCGPCKMVAPKIVAMADELTEKCVFLKVDVDEADDVSEEYNIQAMPTFILFRNGVKVADMAGADAAKLRKLINDNI